MPAHSSFTKHQKMSSAVSTLLQLAASPGAYEQRSGSCLSHPTRLEHLNSQSPGDLTHVHMFARPHADLAVLPPKPCLIQQITARCQVKNVVESDLFLRMHPLASEILGGPTLNNKI